MTAQRGHRAAEVRVRDAAKAEGLEAFRAADGRFVVVDRERHIVLSRRTAQQLERDFAKRSLP